MTAGYIMTWWRTVEDKIPRDGTVIDLWAVYYHGKSGNVIKTGQFQPRRFADCHYIGSGLDLGWRGLDTGWTITHWMPTPGGPK